MPDSAFRKEVTLRFQTYNGLFLELPFEQVKEDGILLPLFARRCADALAEGRSPGEIVPQFFADHSPANRPLYDTLYSLLQLAERQVVLFDAIEDAAYGKVYGPEDAQSLITTLARVAETDRQTELVDFLDDYRVRIVLTAHPTQFYPDEILGIIADLSEAIRSGEVEPIYELLLQMGKTRFRNRQKPSPKQEANSLLWYLENVFYGTMPAIQARLDRIVKLTDGYRLRQSNVELGFWPGGDRDGNPFVTVDTTRTVAQMLHDAILDCYENDLKQLKRRLTFPGVVERIREVYEKIRTRSGYRGAAEFLADLEAIRDLVEREHRGLFLDRILDLIVKARIFGFHFATIDLRQDSRIHRAVVGAIHDQLGIDYVGVSSADRHRLLSNALQGGVELITPDLREKIEDPRDVLGSIGIALEIQESNGPRGLHRYIISNTQESANVLEVLYIAAAVGHDGSSFPIDIVPLFETIDDLVHAESIMESLYDDPVYGDHLERRDRHQTIMLGFSDGTKDGGYVAANWRIFRTKATLTAQANRRGIRLTFFDGRGGPPARGGGNTHRFYRAMGREVSSTRIHLTIQGQTISSKFGTLEAAEHNVGQIVSAGILNALFSEDNRNLDADATKLLDKLADTSLASYLDLRNSDAFLPFLEEVTPLRYYGRTTIGSRPARRAGGKISLETLRAIPFVGAWSQMKMNVPGFYGLGTAVERLVADGEEDNLHELYRTSLFVRTLFDNAMQSLSKTRYDLTRYLAQDERFGAFWQTIADEAERSISCLLRISGRQKLLENDPNIRASIRLREKLILPVAVIQQWALQRIRDGVAESEEDLLEDIVIKSMAASVNASRNAV